LRARATARHGVELSRKETQPLCTLPGECILIPISCGEYFSVDHIAVNIEIVLALCLIERVFELNARLQVHKKWSTLATTECEEVEIVGSLETSQSLRHGSRVAVTPLSSL
jgi:hypothetical protein